MDRLPDELILQILTHLDLRSNTRVQRLNRRFLYLARDESTWRLKCFNDSRAGRAFQLASTDKSRVTSEAAGPESRPSTGTSDRSTIRALRDAVSSFTARTYIFGLGAGHGQDYAHEGRGPSRLEPMSNDALRSRAIANWDPGYQHERVDYYQEYVRRHASFAPVNYLKTCPTGQVNAVADPELLGLGVLCGADRTDTVDKVVAHADDGAVRVWDVSVGSDGRRSGRMIGQSRPGLLGEDSQSMTASAVLESVSTDSTSAFFAVDDHVHHVDLDTLRLISSTKFSSTITALSNGDGTGQITVGTTSALHLYDSRDSAAPYLDDEDDTTRCAVVVQDPYSRLGSISTGPTSILSLNGLDAEDHSIWTAGRFKALMIYDRRDLSSPVSTCFSGAQISSLATVPYLQPPADCNLVTNPTLTLSDFDAIRSQPGLSVLAAGEYHGKGSLEIYGAQWSAGKLQQVTTYRNRQTVSSSPALAISPHGASIVVSDGNGLLKWFERDGFTPIRTFDMSESAEGPDSDLSLFPSRGAASSNGDVVRKIIQTDAHACESRAAGLPSGGNDLLLWTGDGRIGVLGYGHASTLPSEDEFDDSRQDPDHDAKMQFERKMGRLLVSQANEARFMSHLGWP